MYFYSRNALNYPKLVFGTLFRKKKRKTKNQIERNRLKIQAWPRTGLESGTSWARLFESRSTLIHN